MELCKKKSHFSTQNECQQIKENGISRVLSDRNGMKLEIKSKRNYRKYMNSRQKKKHTTGNLNESSETIRRERNKLVG